MNPKTKKMQVSYFEQPEIQNILSGDSIGTHSSIGFWSNWWKIWKIVDSNSILSEP